MDEMLNRIEEKLSAKGWSWADFARALNTTDQRVYNWRKRGVPKSEADRIAKALGCSIDWLLTGFIKAPDEDLDSYFAAARRVAERYRRPGDEALSDADIYRRHKEEVSQRTGNGNLSDELEFFGHMDAWDSNTPLDEDEVELPLFREVELAAGGGATQVIENHGAKLRFAKSTLRRAGVPAESAACAFVRGNSMEPVMPDGTCVGVNTADKAIKDGEIYAIDHGGMLRVKYLHRRPGGGIKIVSQNAGEHPVEEVTAEEMAASVRVIGRVFWWSVLR
jgi:phage repressor protein C with HTH and peptisase S24 domain